MTPGRRKTLIGLALGLAASLTWGLQASVARSGALSGLTPLDVVTLRFLAAGAVLAPFAWAARGMLARLGPWKLLVLVATGGGGNALLFNWAVLYAPASHAGTIAPVMSAVMGVLLAIPFLREWPTRGRVAALAVIVCGVLMIGWDGIGGEHPGAWRGDLILLVAGSSWGAFTVLLRRWGVPALGGNAAVCVASALLLLPPWLATGLGAVPDAPWQASALQAVMQGVLSSAVATTIYARATELMGATRASSVSAMVPVFAVLFAALLLAEPLGVAKLLGVALAVGGMLAAVLFTGRRVEAR